MPTLLRPLPYTDSLAPEYTQRRGHRNWDFAWRASDAQGMPSSSGGRYHGAVDMFAPAYTDVLAPFDGKIVRTSPSRGSSGQVFGGISAIESASGHAVLFRHVIPKASLGTKVSAGEVIAKVSPWTSGWPHAHTEIYKYYPAPYLLEATLDPLGVDWIDTLPKEAAVVSDYFFEELPHDEGGIGPVVVWHGTGSPLRAWTIHKARGRIVSTVRDGEGIAYVLWWLPGTYSAGLPVFGPWATAASRDRVMEERAANQQRVMRPFRGRYNSNYPIAV